MNERQEQALKNAEIALLNGDTIFAKVRRANPTDPCIVWEEEVFHVDPLGENRYKQLESFVLSPWYVAGQHSKHILLDYSSRYEAFAKIREYCHDTDAPDLQRVDIGHADFYIYIAPALPGTEARARFYLGTREGFNRHFPEMMKVYDQDQEEKKLRERDAPAYHNGEKVDFFKRGVCYPSVIVRYLGRKPGLGKCYLVRAADPEHTGSWEAIKAERFLDPSLDEFAHLSPDVPFPNRSKQS